MKTKTAKRDVRAILLALLVFALAGLLAVSAFAQDVAVPPADRNATQAVIGDQLEAFRSGDHARAYSHAAPGIKSYFDTVDKFIAMVAKGYGPVYAPQDYTFGRNTVIDGEVYQEVIITDHQGKQWQAVYTLQRQEDGSWKITGVKINPHRGASV
ncbi:MAG: DUF4864 domain-containing protein [Nitratireductor sp.]|nr:DUF4864 domain-containing protein [Nitratireductor sp.]